MGPGFFIDIDKRKSVIRRLTDALYDFLTLGLDDARSQGFENDKTAMLIQAKDAVEAMRQNIEQAEAGMDAVPEELRPMFKAGVIGPLRMQLQAAEKRLTEIQEDLEGSA
jgi:hypothetical protein